MTAHRTRLLDRWLELIARDRLSDELHAASDAGQAVVLLHTCAHGHTWRQQPDVGVSPSYALALTSFKLDGWDPARCPEPARFPAPGDPPDWRRAIACGSCGRVALAGDLFAGVSCTPWDLRREFERTGHFHRPPPPACGQPPVRTLAWQSGDWVEVRDGVTAPVGQQISLL